MIVHAALDMFEVALDKLPQFYLKTVDKYGEWTVAAQLAATGDRFMLLHDGRPSEDHVRQFFADCHDLYTRLTLNPFYQAGACLNSGPFEVKVRLLAKKHLDK